MIVAMIAALVAPVFGQTNEAQLLDVLKKTDAAQKDKFDACRELARIGTKTAVPVLAALLTDETYSHMARYGLEPIPDPSVDDAFRAALGKVKGKLLAGVINSIGVRRDEKAVDALANFLGDSDAEVAFAASASLGKIGSKNAIAALEKCLATNPTLAAGGLLRCGQTALENGRGSAAVEIFDKVRAAKVPDHVRLSAIRGSILAGENMSLLAEELKSSDPSAVSAALRAALEGKGSKWSKALAGVLTTLPPEKQIPVLQALGVRRDDVAESQVASVAKENKNADVRVAAIQALTMIGSADSVPSLIELMNAPDEVVSKAAKSSIGSFSAKGTDDAIAALLKKSEAVTRCTAIDLLAQRRAVSAIPKLVKCATDADETIRIASIEALGKIGGEAEVSPMLSSLLIATSPKEAKAAETALSGICTRAAASPACAEKLLASMSLAKGETKLALLRILRSIGGPKALDAVRAATSDSNAEIKDTAIRALCDWPTADALPDLTQFAKSSPNETIKILALRGAIRVAPLQAVDEAKKAAILADLFALASRNDEKKLALGSLGDVADAAALSLATQQISNEALKNEACLAAVSIGEKLVETKADIVADAMKQVLKAQPTEGIVKRARQVLGKAKKS